MPIDWIVTGFKEVLWPIIKKGGWKGLIEWLLRRGPVGLRVGSLVCLVTSIVAGVWWWWGTRGIQDLFAQTLSSPLEATSQPYKGLEAFALAGLDDYVSESFQNVNVHDKFAKLSQDFEDALFKDPKILPTLRVMPRPGLALAQTYITDTEASNGTRGFLFVPAMILRIGGEATQEKIIKAATNDPQLSAEIRVSASVADKICEFETIPLFNDVPPLFRGSNAVVPVQSYLITRSGLMRVCESNIINQEAYYTKQFVPNTFFPDRPYFSDTINRFPAPTPAQSGQPVSKSLWITKPYIDLGGNGVVVTMSRRVRVPWDDESALFVDISLGTAAEEFISKKVEAFGGTATPITCVGSPVSCGNELGLKERGLLNTEIASISDGSEVRSEIFGKIHVFASSKPKKIIFTIPLARYFAVQGNQYALLYCTIDLEKLRLKNALKAGVSGGSFLLFLFLIGAIIADFGLQLRGQERAFTTIAKVMGKVPVAYCRIDEHDQFLDANDAFLTILGYQSKKELLEQSKTFAGLLANEESRKTYEKIQRIRKGDEPEPAETESYRLVLWQAGRSEKPVVVYGGTVPAPRSERHEMPQTFGILLEVYDSESIQKPAAVAKGEDISGEWKYKCIALSQRYSHGGKLKIEMRTTAYGPQWRLVGTREWREIEGRREENINYVWGTDWAAFTDKDRIKYTYKATTDKGLIQGFADGAITEWIQGDPVKIAGTFYQLPPLEPMYGQYEFTKASAESTTGYSCFISYSSKDQTFVERLHSDLQAKGVLSWFAPEDLKTGDKLRPAFDEAIRTHDKLLVVLSESSIRSPWVEKEVETAFEKEQKQDTLVLFPIRLDAAVMTTTEAWAADIRRTRHIGDFSDWKNHDSYKEALDRLVQDLKAAATKL